MIFDRSFQWGSDAKARFGYGTIPYTRLDRIGKISEELRVAGSIQKLEWLAGTFVAHEEQPGEQFAWGVHPAPGRQRTRYYYGKYGSQYDEAAAFASVTYRLTDRVDVQLGGRESRYSNVMDAWALTGPVTALSGQPDPWPQPRTEGTASVFTYSATP